MDRKSSDTRVLCTPFPCTLQLKYPHLLPESAESLQHHFGFNSCAIVGNSGSLLYTKFGAVIDKHDVVFRLNQVGLPMLTVRG